MKDIRPTYDDFLQKLDIRDVLTDAGYRQNRRFGLRLPSYVRMDSEGRRIRGDKFVITQQGKCCFQPLRQREYNVIAFIEEHPQLFAEYREGMEPDRLVELVCSRLLNLPVEERAEPIERPRQELRPFDIADYDLYVFDPQDWATQGLFAPYFEHRGIDRDTQHAFYRDFCLATERCEDGGKEARLAFPMTLPKDAGRIVGFEKHGSDSDKGMDEGRISSEGLWIASPTRTPLSEAKHIYWFENACDAMAYYQLHRKERPELRKAVFVSTGGEPTEKQMRGVLELTVPAIQHICFENNREGWHSAWNLQKEIRRTVRCAIEETPERKAYLDSIPDGGDLTDGEFYLLPKGGLQESSIRFDAEREEAASMSSSGLCPPEDIQEQINTMNKCYREYRERLREFLGIDREHDVAFTCEEADYRHTSWSAQLLAEQSREVSVGQESEQEESAEQERQTHFRR